MQIKCQSLHLLLDIQPVLEESIEDLQLLFDGINTVRKEFGLKIVVGKKNQVRERRLSYDDIGIRIHEERNERVKLFTYLGYRVAVLEESKSLGSRISEIF